MSSEDRYLCACFICRSDRLESAFSHFLDGMEEFCTGIGYPEDREFVQRIIRETRGIMRGEKT